MAGKFTDFPAEKWCIFIKKLISACYIRALAITMIDSHL